MAPGQAVVRVGSASYTTSPPSGAKSPPETIYQTENVPEKMPTNDWWSSLAWLPFSARMYAHPLAFRAGGGLEGLRSGWADHGQPCRDPRHDAAR